MKKRLLRRKTNSEKRRGYAKSSTACVHSKNEIGGGEAMPIETTITFSTDELVVVHLALDHMQKPSSGSRPVREIAQHLVKRIEAEVGVRP